jgi:hypothetical protein
MERLADLLAQPSGINREAAFILVLDDAAFAQAGAASTTVKLVAVQNLIPAITAFDSSIDQLKHPEISIQSWRSNDRHQKRGDSGLTRFY